MPQIQLNITSQLNRNASISMDSRVQQISGEDHVSCCRSKLTGQQQIVLSCLWLHESDSKCLVVKIHSSIFGVVDYCRPYCHFAIHPWTFQSRFKTFLFLISGSMWSRNRIGRTTGNEANDLLSQAMHLLFCGTVVVYTPKQQQSYIYCVWIFKCCLLLVFCILLRCVGIWHHDRCGFLPSN